MSRVNYISFPGLGIGEMRINKIAFTLFGRGIAWYGIILTLGIIAGVLYVLYRAKHDEGVSSDNVLDLAIYAVVSAIVGARLYYVLTSFDKFRGDTLGETLYNCIAVWEGGIAIYGAIIGGGIAALIFARIKKINCAKLFDMLAPAVMLGQIIGRWGNFVNAEAYGSLTNLPWRMGIRGEGSAFTMYVHPTFLYESLWNLVGFVLINLFYRKKKFNGQIFLCYISWYGFGRMLIEGLRTDSLYVGNFRISQVVGGLTFVIGVVLLAVLGIRAQKAPATLEATSNDGDKASNEASASSDESSANGAGASNDDGEIVSASASDEAEENGSSDGDTADEAEGEGASRESTDSDEQ